MCCCRACATKGVLLLGRLVLSLQGGLTFGGVLLLGRGLTFGGGGLFALNRVTLAIKPGACTGVQSTEFQDVRRVSFSSVH